MANITFSGGATLSVTGSAEEVGIALDQAAREGRYCPVGDDPITFVNPAQVAYVADPPTDAATRAFSTALP